MNFKKNLDLILKDKKLKYPIIYKTLNMQRQTFYVILKRNNPTIETVNKIRNIIKCDFNDLLIDGYYKEKTSDNNE